MRNKNVPEVRFPGFPDTWEQRMLGDVAPLQRGFDLTKSTMDKGPYPVVFSNGIGAWNSEYKVKAPGVVTGRSGSIGNVSYIEQDYWPHNTSLWVTNFFDNYPLFIYYLYHQVDLSKFGTGSGVPTLNRNDVHNYSVSIPQANEQIEIANFLKQLDRTIALHKQELTSLKQTKQGFLQKMFPNEGESVPEVRFPDFVGHWNQRKLSELADFFKGNGYSKADLTEKGIPIILYGRLYTKYETVIEVVDTFTSIEKEKSIVSKGKEVIVPSSGETSEDISRASVVNEPGIILGGDLNIIQPTNEIDSVFLALSISNGEQRKELIRRAQGKSVVHLHNSDLKEVNLLFPCKEEQIIIGNFFKQLDDTIALQEKELEALQQTKKAFLQKMFV